MDIEYTPDDIDAFVKGTLSPEKHNIFLQKLKENEALANAVAEAQFHFDVATRLIERDLRKMLNDWEAEKKTPPPPPSAPPEPSPTPSRSIWWAASVVLVVAVVLGLRNFFQHPVPTQPFDAPANDTTARQPAPHTTTPPQTPPTPPKKQDPNPPLPPSEPKQQQPQLPLPQAAAQPEPYEPSNEQTAMLDDFLHIERGDTSSTLMRSDDIKKLPLLEQGDALIAQKRYEDGIRQLESIRPNDEDYWTAQMLIGDAHFFQKKYREAEQAYLTVQKQGSGYGKVLRWRLATVYSAQGQKDRLKAHLQDILNDTSHRDHNRANRLLNAIR